MRLFFSLLLAAMIAMPAFADDIPRFQVEPAWPKPLPNDWIMGQAAGVAVDAQDHIWVIQRPRTLTDDEKALTLNPPPSKCCRPAPPVMEFDGEGNLIQGAAPARATTGRLISFDLRVCERGAAPRGQAPWRFADRP